MPPSVSWYNILSIPYRQIRLTNKQKSQGQAVTIRDYLNFKGMYRLLKRHAFSRGFVICNYDAYRWVFDDHILPDGRVADAPVLKEADRQFFARGSEFDNAIERVLNLNQMGRKYYIRIVLDQKVTFLKRMELLEFRDPLSDDENDGTMYSDGYLRKSHTKEMLWHA
jgi:hypothetical protein